MNMNLQKTGAFTMNNKPRIKRELIYTMPYETPEDQQAVDDKRCKLYRTFKSVLVYPNGSHEIRLIATNNTN